MTRTTPELTAADRASLSVFISYAREDTSVRGRLQALLEADGVRVLGDWALAHGPDFWAQLVGLIQQADVIVALISPDFAASAVGRREIDTAVGFGKRILPVVVRDLPDPDRLPKALRTPQWAFLRSDGEFDADARQVARSLHTDFEDLRLHRDLLLEAERWAAAGRDRSLVLRGGPLAHATAGLARMQSRDERWFPKPTAVQIEFLAAGAAETRRRRATAAILVAAALVLAAGAGYAIVTRARALAVERQGRQNQEDLQNGRRLLAAARSAGDGSAWQAQLRVLLAAEASKLAPLPESHRELRESLHLLGDRRASMPLPAGQRFSAWSDDGRRMATIGADHAIHVYDTARGIEVSVHRGFPALRTVAFSHDGAVLAAAGDDASRIVDLASGTTGPPLAIGGRVSLSADGAYAASETAAGAIVYDTRTGQVALDRRTAGRNGRVSLSPDGKRLLSLGFLMSVSEVASGRVAETPLAAFGNQWVINPDGRTVAVADSKSVLHLIDVASGSEMATRTEAGVTAVLFDPAGVSLAVVTLEGVRVLAARDLSERFWFPYRLTMLAAFNRDATVLALTDYQRTRVVDLQRGSTLSLIDHDTPVVATAFTETGDLMAVTGSESAQVLSRYAVPARFLPYRDESDLYGFDYSRARSALAIAHQDGRIGVYDAATGRATSEVRRAGHVSAVAFSADGALLAAGGDDKAVQVFDLASRRAIREIRVPAAPRWLAFDDRASIVAVATDDSHGRVYDVAAGRLIQDVTTAGVVNFVTVSPDGSLFAIAGEDGTVQVHAIATGKQVLMAKHAERVTAVAFSPDGRLLATASDDKTSRVYDVTSGALVATAQHPDSSLLPAFSPDGALLATLDDDDVLRVYDARSGALLHVIQPPDEAFFFFVDARRLMTAWVARDRLELREHALDPAVLLAEACSRLTRPLSEDEWAEHFPDQAKRATCPTIK